MSSALLDDHASPDDAGADVADIAEVADGTLDAASELVTVVIPARNEQRSIRAVLDSVLAQTHSELQVIVVDGVSTDATAQIVAEVAARDPRVELVLNADRVIPLGLNLAADRARSRWLVRVDAHSQIPADYVESILAHLRSGRWGGVGGRKNGRGRTAAGRAIAAAMGSKFGQGNSVYHYGTEAQPVDHIPFGAYPLEVVRELGGWSETQLVNEDFEFDYRVRASGRELLFDPAISIDWECRQNVADLFRQYRRYGSGKVQTLLTHPEAMAVRNLAAPGLIAALGASLVLLPWRRTRKLAIAMAAPYVVLLGAGTATTVGSLDGIEEKFWVAPAFAAMHVGWGLGFWSEVLAALRNRGGARPGLAASPGT